MNNFIKEITLREKVGQLFFPAAFINDTDENIQALEKLIKTHNIGGLTFFHSRSSAATNYEGKKNVIHNDNSASRLKELIIHYQSISKYPLLISIDAEWGLAMRVEKTPQYPYAITLGAIKNNANELIYEVGKQTAIDLKKIGIHYNLAPVIDINDNPKNPVIGYRSFGDDRIKVTRNALSYYNGMQKIGVLGCLKHFPGHGNTSVDSHLGLPVIEKTLNELHEQELYPFKEAIKQGIDSIMVGHLAVPALTNGKIVSATLSSEIIQDVLRNELGFNGLIISDALNMHSVSKLYPEKGALEWKAFEAGNDILCFSENVAEGIESILKNGKKEQIDASFERLIQLKTKAKLFKNHSDNSSENLQFDFEITSNLNQKIANETVSIFKNESLLIPLNKNKKTAIVSIYKDNTSQFCKTIANEWNPVFMDIPKAEHLNSGKIISQLQDFDTIVIGLFVPSIKPANHFEIDESVLKLLEKLFMNPKVILCHFGNPYAIATLPNSEKLKNLIISYQHFDEFQIATAKLLIY